jgi:superoxide dismutase, Cu-Zn family
MLINPELLSQIKHLINPDREGDPMNRLLISATILSLCLFATGCKNDNKNTEPAGHHKMADQNMKMATANIEPTKGNSAKGTVTFHQTGDKVHVMADISGLTPNAKHGFHIHEGTECGEDGMKAGGHYNPEKHDHGLPNAPADKRHAGDFGNLQADANGKAKFEGTFDNISISGSKNPIVGHAIIVHKNPDDGSQPVGNAGPRIGCGIIKAGGGARAELQVDQLASQPAIRLSQVRWGQTFGAFVMCQACTTPDFSKEVADVYRGAGWSYETKANAAPEHKYTVAWGTVSYLGIGPARAVGTQFSGTTATTATTKKASGAK